MNARQEYLRRLADIDATVAGAQAAPEVVLERAAGLLAGRAGCRINEAHAQLLQLASEQARDPGAVAADLVAALEGHLSTEPAGVRSMVEDALHPKRRRATDRLPAARLRSTRSVGSGDGDWATIMQQVLDTMSGNHTVVVPLHNAGGEVEDYVFVAVSSAVVDVLGRRGPQLVGRPVSEVYPAIVGGPVWHGWNDVLASGAPREVGPVPYDPASDQAQITLLVRVHPVGPGLLSSWVRPDEQDRLSERIAQTERLGGLGWGEWDLTTDRVVWSDELYRIYERDPAEGPLSRHESEALRLPEDAPIHRQAAVSFGRGETVDITYRVRIRGRVKYLRSVIDAVRDSAGRPVKVYGIVQDVTARETSRAKLAEVQQQLDEQRQNLAAEHRLAAQLQQIILPIPAAPVRLPGLQVAVRYLPAEQASRVGGDWFHAAATDDGDVLLAVGDVAGHGIRAATSMALLRHALAALSITISTDPAELLSNLNRLLYAGGSAADTATAVIARYHPPTGALVWAQAGHPPLLRTRGGVTVELERPRGPLLGALRDAGYDTASTTIDDGDLLLLYTDGLVEHRRQSRAEGFAPVVETLNAVSGAPEAPLTALLARLLSANPDDDTCILAARPSPGCASAARDVASSPA